jgi:diacylglycerol kinase (ATP)
VLIGQLRRLLNPIQVWDLADGSPERVLQSFCALTRLRIMVCGGDGTVSWIISCIEEMQLERWPPIAILPLGTGNDLARIHGWGGGYTNESLIEILEQVAASYISLLDRWEMKIENKKGKVKAVKSFFNYVGFGADAQAALQVHMLRESKPQLFFSRLFNKMWYFVFGAEEAIKESNINLPNEIVVIADGVEVPLPPDSQGIIMLNIDSYSGGVPVWSHGDKGNICYIGNNDNSDSASIDGAASTREPVDLYGHISPRRVRSMG